MIKSWLGNSKRHFQTSLREARLNNSQKASPTVKDSNRDDQGRGQLTTLIEYKNAFSIFSSPDIFSILK